MAWLAEMKLGNRPCGHDFRFKGTSVQVAAVPAIPGVEGPEQALQP